MHRGIDAAIPPSRLFDFSLFGSDSGRSSDSDDSCSDSGSSTAPSIERMDDDSSISSGNSSISSIDTIDRLIEQRFDASIFGQQPPTEIDVPFAFADLDGTFTAKIKAADKKEAKEWMSRRELLADHLEYCKAINK